MKIALAQLNAVVGGIADNTAKILRYATLAEQQGATLLVTPELAVCGYPPEDLLLREDFVQRCDGAVHALAAATQRISILIGHPVREAGHLYNALSLLSGGTVVARYHKRHIPNYEVFDEARYFTAGEDTLVFEHQGVRIGVLICADLWQPEYALAARNAGAQCLLVANASPYYEDKLNRRYAVARDRVAETVLPVLYANLVGGQDDLVFDGASFVLGEQGELLCQLPAFEEHLGLVVWQEGRILPSQICPLPERLASVYQALCLGLRDYVEKNGFRQVLVGLSGGIDSALTLAIAVDALGAERVWAVMMPTRFTAQMSLDDADQIARNLQVRYSQIAIEPLYEAFSVALASEFANLPSDLTEENLQSRIRGMLLMALSNKKGALVLTTSNKSEAAVGYGTLYGDMAGGFAVLKDVCKTLVYELADYRNTLGAVIPARVMTRAPSAELRDNQTDQDSLPAYSVLDAVMQAYAERDISLENIVAMGYDAAEVRQVVRLINAQEYKRRQSPVGTKITPRGFGRDRRYPITSHYRF